MSVNKDGKIVSFNDFKRKKAFDQEVAEGRTPLYLSHLEGKVSGSPHLKGEEGDFNNRVQRVRRSLDRINKLMSELKKLPQETT